jgi:hypothetical protein
MNKVEYIKRIEDTEGIFSILTVVSLVDSTNKIDNNKNLELVYMETEFINNKPNFKSKLYKTSTGFYIYWKRHLSTDNINKFEITIYHKPENINEIIIFLSQLNKK